MGVTQGAGLSLQWLRNQLAPGVSYDELMAEAATAPAGSQGLFWLPYLMGERTPHLDPSARGGWIGLTAKHTRADLIRSVVEGVSYSQKDCLDIVEELGVPVSSVRASGGGARSPFWRQILADVFREASRKTGEPGGLGLRSRACSPWSGPASSQPFRKPAPPQSEKRNLSCPAPQNRRPMQRDTKPGGPSILRCVLSTNE